MMYAHVSLVPAADTMGRRIFFALTAGVGAGTRAGAAWAVSLWMSSRRVRMSVGVSAGHSMSQLGAGHLMVAMITLCVYKQVSTLFGTSLLFYSRNDNKHTRGKTSMGMRPETNETERNTQNEIEVK